MLIDAEDPGFWSLYRLKDTGSELVNERHTDVLYQKYRLSSPNKKIIKHIINWLFTVKCESNATGIRYIDMVLWALKRTLSRDLDDIQFSYIKGLIQIFLIERKQYMVYNYGRNLA